MRRAINEPRNTIISFRTKRSVLWALGRLAEERDLTRSTLIHEFIVAGLEMEGAIPAQVREPSSAR
jgi:hypothetical protein